MMYRHIVIFHLGLFDRLEYSAVLLYYLPP